MTTRPPQLQAPLPLAADFEVACHAQWLALVDKVLKGGDFAKRLVSRTADGLEIQPLYTRTSADEPPPPGTAPYTRGTALRTGQPGWRIAQLRTQTDPAQLAAAIQADVAGGADAVTIRIAAPGQTGLAADPAAFEAAFAGVPLDYIRINLLPGGAGLEAAGALAIAAAKPGGLKSSAPATIGRLGIDPLGTLARTGNLVGLDRTGDRFATRMPWLPAPTTTLLADATPYHEAGASEAQELAALLATLVSYLRACEADGIAPADALPRMSLALAADADLFLVIAKLRAARNLVWRVADACGAGPAAGLLPLSVTTSERMMARRDPWVNLLRMTAACTAAAMGGADEVTVLPHTWALGQTDAFASRIARNIGLVLREEASLGRVGDPAGGAWYVEHLTKELATKAWATFQAWEAEGGMLAAMTSGMVHDQIAAVADARARSIATGRIELTGTSAFPRLDDDNVKVEPWPAAPRSAATLTTRPLPPRRLAGPFERLRDAADAATHAPQVFLAALGTPADFGARSTWISNFLATGGVGVIAGDGFTNSADAGRAFAGSGATLACICSSDAVYGELAEATAMTLKGAGCTRVYLAGRPRDEEALRAAGVDEFLFAGIHMIETLRGVHKALGLTGT